MDNLRGPFQTILFHYSLAIMLCVKIYTAFHFKVLHIKIVTIFSATYNYFRLKDYSINIKIRKERYCNFFSPSSLLLPPIFLTRLQRLESMSNMILNLIYGVKNKLN